MNSFRTRATRIGKRKLVALFLALVVVVAGAAVVYAKAQRPDFKLSASPAARNVTQGQTAKYKIAIKRVHKFKGSISLSVSKLPKGARATWALADGRTLPGRAKSAGVLPKNKKNAVLSIVTAANTPIGNFKPVVKGKGGKRTHKKTLHLNVAAPVVAPGPGEGNTPGTNPGGSNNPPAQASLTVQASPATQNLLTNGDEVSYTISLARSSFSGPVTMSASGLPSGVTGQFVGGNSVSGNSVTLKLTSASVADIGSKDFTVKGTGGGTSDSGLATVVVQQTVPFDVSGDATTALVPGQTVPIHVSIDNPYGFDLKVTDLSVAASTTKANCADSNFQVSQFSGTYPITVPPGTHQLDDLVPTASERPQLAMQETGQNQDNCRNATVTLDYSGQATK